MSELRDWDSPEYRSWRSAVKKRDGYKCRMPNCGSRKRLQAHHVKRHADFPSLRFDVSNGVTLCRRCHDRIAKSEEEFEALFARVLNPSIEDLLIRLMMDR